MWKGNLGEFLVVDVKEDEEDDGEKKRESWEDKERRTR